VSAGLSLCLLQPLRAISAEPAGDIVLGQPVPGVGEDPLGRADLDQVAEVEVGGALRYPRGLLHGMGDDDDRVLQPQFIDQVLDPGGGDRVEGRAGLVHQDDFGADGDGPGDAQPLLLSARQSGPRFMQAVLHFFPQPRLVERDLDDLLELGLVAGEAMDLRPVGACRRLIWERGSGFWKTMPTRARSGTTSTDGA